MSVDIIQQFAAKYIWWKKTDEAALFPRRVIAQVMNLGTFEDVQRLIGTFGAQRLIEVIKGADAGWFSPRSWHYWHFRLGLARPGQVPPLPVRHIP